MADGTSTATADSGTTTDSTATDTTATTDTTSTDEGGIKLTPEQKAFVDQIVARRVNEGKARMDNEVEKRVAEQLKREKMDAAERAAAERDEARKEAEDTKGQSRREVAEARVETALLAAGIKPQRIDAVARLVNLDDVAGADDQKQAAAAAVQSVLADFPEFRPTPGASGGELGGGGGGAGAVTLEQFKGMDYDARAKLASDNIALYRQLRDQEQGA